MTILAVWQWGSSCPTIVAANGLINTYLAIPFFSRWQVLQYDTDIAGVVRFIGWTCMILPVLWIGWRWWSDRKHIAVANRFDR